MIANEIGYNSPSNFSRAFKDWFGVLPTEHSDVTKKA